MMNRDWIARLHVLLRSKANSSNHKASKLEVEKLEDRWVPSTFADINFQPAAVPVPAAYFPDTGGIFANRGNGFSYGWNADITANTRVRHSSLSPDVRYDTVIHMQKPNDPNAVWEMAVPNGTYTVHLVAGDPSYTNSVYKINVEGTLAIDGTPSQTTHWIENTVTVMVSDGRLTISNAAGSINNKIDFVDISTASTVPAAPTNLAAAAGNGQVSLSWTASAGATTYSVYRSTSPGGEGSTPVATGVTSTSFTDSRLADAATYYYQVTAVNAAGQSGKSTEVSATPAMSAGSSIYWNTKNWYLSGVNYAWHNYATDFGTGGWGHLADANGVATDFAAMASNGVHITRWWVFGDGRYSPKFNSDGTVSGLDSFFFPDLDKDLQTAANNHIYLILTLLDSSIMNNAQIVNGVQLGGHKAILTDPRVEQSYLDNALKPLLQHIAASPYKNMVLAYDIINEPEADIAGDWGGQNIQASVIQSFVKANATYIHTYDPGAYATVGSAMPQYVNTWKGLGLDFYQLHYYPWMDFSQGAGAGLPTYAALNLDKPCIVGEFSTTASSYGLNDTNGYSAEWYLNTILARGYAGALGWAVTDTQFNWSSFAPVFANWEQAHASIVGPQ